MRKSAYFSDLIFTFCASALPALCFLRYRRAPLFWAFVVAVLFGFGVTLIVAQRMRKRFCLRALKASEQREREMLSLHLAMLSQGEQTAFFTERAEAVLGEKALRNSILGEAILGNAVAERNGDEILSLREASLQNNSERAFSPSLKNDNEGEIPSSLQNDSKGKRSDGRVIETTTMVAYCRFRVTPLLADDTLPLITSPTDKTPILVCNALTDDAKSLINRFGVHAIYLDEVYAKLKEAELLPTKYHSAPAFSKRKKRILSGFSKRNARPFLTGGAMVLVSSLYSPFPYYYLVFGVALTAVAVFVKVFARKE